MANVRTDLLMSCLLKFKRRAGEPLPHLTANQFQNDRRCDMRRRTRLRSLLAVSAVALIASACGSSGGPSTTGASNTESTTGLGGNAAAQTLNNLYKQAQESGKTSVVIYSDDAPYLNGVFAAFNKRYPNVSVTASLLVGTQLETRLQEEFLTNKHTADLLDVPGNEIWYAYQKGELASYMPATAHGLNGKYQVIGPNNTWMTPYAKLGGILYNNSVVSESSAPKSYADLLNPKWKGKIVITDPEQFGATSSYLIYLTDNNLVPPNFISRFKAQDPKVVAHFPQLSEAVASGQYPIGFPYDVESLLQDKAKGAPEALVLPPSEGAGIADQSFGLLKGAPDESAAELLEAWLFTPEGQQALASQGLYGTMPGSPSPKGFPGLSSIKVIPQPGPSQANAVLDKGIGKLVQVWSG